VNKHLWYATTERFKNCLIVARNVTIRQGRERFIIAVVKAECLVLVHRLANWLLSNQIKFIFWPPQ
jgi:hypothetical protein